MLGVTRIIADAYKDTAEFAIVVADPWQKLGLGSVLMDYVLEIAQKKDLRKIYAVFLADNQRMKQMLEHRQFSITEKEDFMKGEKLLK